MTPSASEVARVLASALAAGGQAESVLDESLVPALVDMAIAHRVGPALLETYPALGDELTGHVRQEAMRHLAAQAPLRRTGAALDAADIPWVVVKGPVLAELSYGTLPRGYGDLDIVVSPARLHDATTALRDVGYVVGDRNWRLANRKRTGQLHLGAAPTVPGVDLHWHLVNPRRHRERWRLPMGELLDRRSVDPRVGAPVLDASDRLVHYGIHAAISGGFQLGWLKDIERTVANDPPDWDVLVERSRRWRVGLPVAAMLERTAHTLRVGLPDGLTAALTASRSQSWLVHQLRDWTPIGRLPGGGSLDRSVLRALVDTVPATTIGLAEQAVQMLERQVRPHPYWLDPDHPKHMLYDSGGAEGEHDTSKWWRPRRFGGHTVSRCWQPSRAPCRSRPRL